MGKESPNDYFQLRKLRTRAPLGIRRKKNVKLTFTQELLDKANDVVGFGQGKYTSPLMELATKLLLELATSGEDLPAVTRELKEKCISPYLINNIERLNRMIKV